jgi:DNA-binding CsgD family transcriptional regulator
MLIRADKADKNAVDAGRARTTWTRRDNPYEPKPVPAHRFLAGQDDQLTSFDVLLAGRNAGSPSSSRSSPADVRWEDREIAVLLSISHARVSTVLREAGIHRRDSHKACPVDPDTLRGLVAAGATPTSIAREHGVSHPTATRWFAAAGMLRPDPKAGTDRLTELYVNRQLTTREVAAELGISKGRVISALTAAGIPRRPRSVRRPPRRPRGGHRRRAGQGLPPSGHDDRAGRPAFRGQ